ncbi:MAG TPA: DUF4097 family beta strand repeat-containing protein [Vicinamibacterales bacterium]
MTRSIRRALAIVWLPAIMTATGCDLMTAGMRSEATDQWHTTLKLEPNGRLDVTNINGKISVEPSSDATIDVTATKKAHGASDDAAKDALKRITIDATTVSSTHVTIETKIPKTNGISFGGSSEVDYEIKVPAGAELHLSTVNGTVEVTGEQGAVHAETTNGSVKLYNVAGQVQAETVNGSVSADLARVADAGAKLECVNGSVKLTLPKDTKATLSADVTNGGIDTGGLTFEAADGNTRRHFEGRLNGGGARISLETTNGGISVAGK